ncbi:hypothetical protein FB451DRAFT_1190020 [Mycena latifolia]|nr:hypothetical protein FB451DRAFT_1190020 [Mycena latifolia]
MFPCARLFGKSAWKSAPREIGPLYHYRRVSVAQAQVLSGDRQAESRVYHRRFKAAATQTKGEKILCKRDEDEQHLDRGVIFPQSPSARHAAACVGCRICDQQLAQSGEGKKDRKHYKFLVTATAAPDDVAVEILSEAEKFVRAVDDLPLCVAGCDLRVDGLEKHLGGAEDTHGNDEAGQNAVAGWLAAEDRPQREADENDVHP